MYWTVKSRNDCCCANFSMLNTSVLVICSPFTNMCYNVLFVHIYSLAAEREHRRLIHWKRWDHNTQKCKTICCYVWNKILKLTNLNPSINILYVVCLSRLTPRDHFSIVRQCFRPSPLKALDHLHYQHVCSLKHSSPLHEDASHMLMSTCCSCQVSIQLVSKFSNSSKRFLPKVVLNIYNFAV